jgi:CRP-like cAMP-binding protein
MLDTSRFFDYPTLAESERAHDALFLSHLDEEEWECLLHYTQTRRLSAGEVVVRAGEPDSALYLLTRGMLRVEQPTVRAPRFRLRRASLREPLGGVAPDRTVAAPAVLGEVSFLDGGPRTATLTAITDGSLLRLSQQGFESLGARDPLLARDLAVDLGRILAGRLRITGRSVPGLLD